MKANVPTTTNGGIPPNIRRLRVIAIDYTIGTGTVDDPMRSVTAYYNDDGEHIVTVGPGVFQRDWREEG